MAKYREGLGERLLRVWKKKAQEGQVFSFRALSEIAGMPTELELEHWYDTEPEFKKMIDLVDRVRARRAYEEIDESSKDLNSNSSEWFSRRKYIADELKQKKVAQTVPTVNIILPVDYGKRTDLAEVVSCEATDVGKAVEDS